MPQQKFRILKNATKQDPGKIEIPSPGRENPATPVPTQPPRPNPPLSPHAIPLTTNTDSH